MHTGQEREEGGLLGGGRGGAFPFSPTSIEQYPADVGGEVFEREDEGGGGRKGSTPEKETKVLVVGGRGGDEGTQRTVMDCVSRNTFGSWGERWGGIR